MKYCPYNKNHKNPDDAIFCSVDGARLVEVPNNKICPKCHFSNPIEAVYCKECGTKLPDANGYIDFKVNSSVVCDRILAVDTKQVKTNTDCAIFKLKANSDVDILFEYRYIFKIKVDTSKMTSLNIKWGCIYFLSEDPCQIKIIGANMNIPIAREDTTAYRISVPYGIYDVTFNIDGETEKVHVDLHSESVTVKTKLHKKYCKECGTKLPDTNGCIDFKVNSSVACDRILAVDTKQVKTNTDCAIFKFKANSDVDILFEYRYIFKIKVDTSKMTSLNIKWGYIYFLSGEPCKIKIIGANMNIPIVRENTTTYRISVPYGIYDVTFNIDGETEKVHVDLHSESVTVKTKLHKKHFSDSKTIYKRIKNTIYEVL